MSSYAAKPWVHFLALGALLFAVKALLPGELTPRLRAEPIEVSAAQVERLRAEWRAETRREPDRAELEALIRRHADEETLLREALRLGLDRSDPVVRTRLVQNLRFARAEPQADARMLLAEALALGMATRDLVARRRLVQAMEERIAAGVRVDDDEARAYVAAHPARYAAPRRVSFDQVFVAGANAPRVAAIEARLAAGQDAPAGDPFLLGRSFTAQSEADLTRGFGGAFARAVMQAPAGAWSGPIGSPYGAHFVRVTHVDAGGAVDAAAVLRQARYALLEERERAAVRARLQALRRAYPLEVEWPALALAGAP